MADYPNDLEPYEVVHEILQSSYPKRSEFDSNFKYQVCRILYAIALILDDQWGG